MLLRRLAHDPALTVSILYLLVISGYLVWHRAWFSPDQFFVAGIFLTTLLGRVRQFIRDWSLPLILYFAYESLRGFSPKATLNVHVFPMIRFDERLFGYLPTIKLQGWLFNAHAIRWYDYASAVLYVSHFIVPMGVSYLFWMTGRKDFKDYTFALLLLSYAAFITYMLFPAMPPWMAAQMGYIPPVQHVLDQVMANFPHPVSLPSVYQLLGANLVAAVPSLHAAYPWLTCLFLVRRFGKWGLLAAPYVAGVWFAVVYLGDHYIFDVVAGVAYATAVFWAVHRRRVWWGWIKAATSWPRASVRPAAEESL